MVINFSTTALELQPRFLKIPQPSKNRNRGFLKIHNQSITSSELPNNMIKSMFNDFKELILKERMTWNAKSILTKEEEKKFGLSKKFGLC